MKLYYDNNEFIYEISSEGDAAMFYQYFNRGIGYNKTSVPVQKHIKLTEDLTQKYKEKYPDAGIESAKIEIITTIHERISALE
jgi:citrate lyase synthetase